MSQSVVSPFAFMGRWNGLCVAALYGFTSMFITFFNKAVFEKYKFNAPNTLTTAQMLLSLLFLVVMRRARLINFTGFEMRLARILWPLAFLFIGMVVTGLAALNFVNIPMYGALRRLTTWIVMVAEQMVLGKSFQWSEQLSVYGMVIGAVIAYYGDLTFHMVGYLLTLLNCVVTALYLVYIPKKTSESGLDSFGMMYYNNLLSLPFMLVLAWVTEAEEMRTYTQFADVGFQFTFFMSSALAFLLNYSIFLCSSVNSPLTTSITGQVKNVGQTVLGLFAFGDVVPTPSLLGGLLVSTLASVWYGQIKFQQQEERRREKLEKEAVRQLEEGEPKTRGSTQ